MPSCRPGSVAPCTEPRPATLPGVAGFDDPHAIKLPNGRSVFYQPDAVHPDGYVLPFRLDTTKTSAAAVHTTTHAWAPQHQSWNDGKMDNWMPAHRAADVVGPLAMGYYTREDIPFHVCSEKRSPPSPHPQSPLANTNPTKNEPTATTPNNPHPTKAWASAPPRPRPRRLGGSSSPRAARLRATRRIAGITSQCGRKLHWIILRVF